jgi:two-component system response regulator AtoC
VRILVVDDEEVARRSVRRLLQRRGYDDVDLCADGREAIAAIRAGGYDIVLLDLLMPGMDGLEVLAAAKPQAPDTEFILVTAVDEVANAVRAVRLGAYDYLVKPVDNERLVLSLERAVEHRGLRAGLARPDGCGGRPLEISTAFANFITASPRMREILAYADIMARSGLTILITGESGTGKELLAQGIHRAAAASPGPLVAVNVAAIPTSLFESQFFGHIKGSFTGAVADQAGFFEQAGNGSLFLDEIGELPFAQQAKLLRAIEEKRVTRIGSSRSIPFRAQLISATNQDLETACREGCFRPDLLYRLKGAHIHLPPLRERREDIPLLMRHFWQEACERHGRSGLAPPAPFVENLLRQDIPGNVRELRHTVEQAVLLAGTPVSSWLTHPGSGLPAPKPLAETGLCSLRQSDARHVRFVLEQAGGNRQAAARILGITARQLYRRLAAMRTEEAGQCLA